MTSHFRTVSTMAAVAMSAATLASSANRVGIDRMILTSEAIVVGTVNSAKTEWGTSDCRWMRTYFSFDLYRVLVAEGGLQPGGSIPFSYWGGQIGEELHAIGGVDQPRVQGSYVMFLKPRWRTHRFFTPVLAFNQGLLPVETRLDGTHEVRDSDGSPLYIDRSGKVVRGWERLRAMPYRPGVSLDELCRYVEVNAARIRSQEPEFPKPNTQRLPAGRPELGVKVGGNGVPRLPGEETVSITPPVRGGRAAKRVDAKAMPGGGGNLDPSYSMFGWLDARPTVNQFPEWDPDWDTWSPEDQYQMSKWNYYCDIFRVRSDGGTGTYGWGNNRFDLDGWPSSDDLFDEYGGDYGSDARWGSDERGVCFTSQNSSTLEIVEGDIAMNPAFTWTLNDEAVYDGSTSKGFHRTMTHELGHMFGLDHQFNYISVENYPADVYRMFGFPTMDDAEGARDTYTSWDISRTDLGVYLFFCDGYQDYDDATYDADVVAGEDLTVNNYHVENVGSANLASTEIEWYLSPERSFEGDDYYLDTYSYGDLDRFHYFNPSLMTITPQVPTSIPGGRYYLGAYIRDDEGTTQSSFPWSNNQAWSRNTIIVYPRLRSLSVADPIVGGEEDPTATLYLYSNMGSDSMTVTLSDTSGYVTTPSSLTLSSSDGNDDTFTITTYYAPSAADVTVSATCKGVTVSKEFRLLVATQTVAHGASGARGKTVRLKARLTRRYDNEVLSGKTINFRVAGNFVGSAVTDSDGFAILSYKIPKTMLLGDHTIRATLPEDNSYGLSSDTATLTVTGLKSP